MSNPPRAIGYLRCSTVEQSESGLGLAAQRAAIAAAAARQGYALADVFTDAGVSGATPLSDRPALTAAIDALHRGDVLIVARRDRLGRDVIEVALIERLIQRKRCRVFSAAGEGNGDDAVSQLQRRMLDAFAEYERSLIAQRTRAALRAKRARGERYAGGIPFGQQLAADGIHLAPCPAEQRIIAVIADLHAAGCSHRRIADALNSENYRTRRGTSWRHQYVAGVIGAACAA